jgi:signal transduction histidine kinase/CheY-like chemotaxis protein/ligand-binding sensor domain-containing protein
MVHLLFRVDPLLVTVEWGVVTLQNFHGDGCNQDLRVEVLMILVRTGFMWLMAFCFSLNLFAQDPFSSIRPAARFWGTGTPFSGATVYNPYRDSLNRIWMGTLSGPAYLEGRTIRDFPLQDETGYFGVRAIQETPDGSMWFGTETNGLWQYQNQHWTHYSEAEGLPSNGINSLLTVLEPNPQNFSLWVGTRGGGVARLSQGGWTLYNTAQGLPDKWIWKLRGIPGAAGSTEIWAATKKGIGIFKDGNWRSITRASGFPPEVLEINDIAKNPGTSAGTDIWASCWGVGLVHWDGSHWMLHKEKGFTSRNSTDLAFSQGPDQSPILWAATYDQGLFWRDRQGWHQMGPAQGFPASGVYGLLPNPGGSPDIWIGTRAAGLASVDLAAWRTVDDRQGLPSSDITCFSKDPGDPDSLWIGTSLGLAHWHMGRWETLQLPGDLKYGRVSAVLATRGAGSEDNLWVGTLKGLILRQGSKWKILGVREGLPETRVRALLEPPDSLGESALWAVFESTLACYQKGRWFFYGREQGLPDEIVNIEATPKPGGGIRIWVVTLKGEVGTFQEGKWIPDHSSLKGRKVSLLKMIRSQDGHPWLWAGLWDGTLLRLDPLQVEENWTAFSLPAQLTRGERIIRAIEADRKSRLYLATTQAYLRVPVDPHTNEPLMRQVEFFSDREGLPAYAQQSIPGLSITDNKGHIWLGTSKGAAVFDPNSETPPPPLPAIRLVRVSADGVALPLTSEAQLSYRLKRLNFEFVLPVYHRPEDIRFQTQLVGLEDGPGPWQIESFREISGLGHGVYKLRIVASDYAGHLSEPLEFSFHVDSPPWERWWAYACYGLLLAGLGYGIVRWRLQALEMDKRALAHIVAERTEELRLRNQDLAEARDKAMQATQAKSEFLANMSHEIRTPLNAILGFSRLGLKINLIDKAHDYFSLITTSGQNLLRIINDILDFSKVEAGRLELEHVVFNVLDIFEQVADLFAQKVAEKKLPLIISAGPGIPHGIIGDPLRLEQVLVNLVGNAIKFTSEGHILVKVRIEKKSQEHIRLYFGVEDTGIGMTLEQQAKLFQAFSQADTSTSRKYGGTGLGLIISKSLVEKMNGKFQVSSHPGTGTTFSFSAEFPLDLAQTVTFPFTSDLNGIHVLVAEPSLLFQKVLDRQLQDAGLVVTSVSSAAAAIKELKTNFCHLILMDGDLLGADHPEVLQSIKEDPGLATIPLVLMVSTFAPDESLKFLESQGIRHFLNKPFGPSRLLKILMEALGKNPVLGPSQSLLSGEVPGDRQLSGALVLLAEDNLINQQVAQEILRGAGIRVDVASTGFEAVHMAGIKDYDAVLMDIQMPEMEGYEAVAHIRQNPRLINLPIIAMTAHAMSGYREECLAAGMNDYVTKPIEPEKLFSVLGRWVKVKPKDENTVVEPLPTTPSLPSVNKEAKDALPGIQISNLLRQLGGNETLLHELINIFLKQYGHGGLDVQNALEKGNWKEAGRIVHTMKGVAGNLQATDLMNASIALENGIKQKDTAQLPSLLSQYVGCLEQLLESYRFLQKSKS